MFFVMVPFRKEGRSLKKPDYYAVLGVAKTADSEEIRRAYRRASLACHPDRFPDDPDKAAEFRRVTEAYEVLSNPEKRRRHDQSAGVTLRHGAGGAVEDYFCRAFAVSTASGAKPPEGGIR